MRKRKINLDPIDVYAALSDFSKIINSRYMSRKDVANSLGWTVAKLENVLTGTKYVYADLVDIAEVLNIKLDF